MEGWAQRDIKFFILVTTGYMECSRPLTQLRLSYSITSIILTAFQRQSFMPVQTCKRASQTGSRFYLLEEKAHGHTHHTRVQETLCTNFKKGQIACLAFQVHSSTLTFQWYSKIISVHVRLSLPYVRCSVHVRLLPPYYG